jgi:hypothetical protein
MRPTRVAQLAAVVVLMGSGAYIGVYLYRWEWNRALIAGMFFVIAEVGLGLALVLNRLGRLEERLDRADPGRREEVLGRLRETAPPARQHFAWLRESSQRTSVFVPVLMGAGVVASALAWVVERLAGATARPALERGLAARLAPLAWPSRGLTDVDPDPLDILARPSPASRR